MLFRCANFAGILSCNCAFFFSTGHFVLCCTLWWRTLCASPSSRCAYHCYPDLFTCARRLYSCANQLFCAFLYWLTLGWTFHALCVAARAPLQLFCARGVTTMPFLFGAATYLLYMVSSVNTIPCYHHLLATLGLPACALRTHHGFYRRKRKEDGTKETHCAFSRAAPALPQLRPLAWFAFTFWRATLPLPLLYIYSPVLQLFPYYSTSSHTQITRQACATLAFTVLRAYIPLQFYYPIPHHLPHLFLSFSLPSIVHYPTITTTLPWHAFCLQAFNFTTPL